MNAKQVISALRAWVGVRDIIGGLVVAGIIAVVSEGISELPFAVTLVLIIVGFVATLWAFIGFRRLTPDQYRPVEFERWDRVLMPALWQAACLWDDLEPYIPVAPGTPSYSTLQMLKSAIMSGEIEVAGEFGHGDAWTRLTRETLRQYAEKVGVRPLSLFPEDRGKP